MSALVIAIVGVAGTIIGVFVTLCASRAQLWPNLEAVFVLEGDWPTATVTVTNTGDVPFSVFKIFLEFNGDKRRIKAPTVNGLSCQKLPKLLESGAAISFSFSASAFEREPVNVKTRIVLELTDGSCLFCERRFFRKIDEDGVVS